MKRLLLAVAITGLLFAALNVSGGATPTASAACGGGPAACGGTTCSWTGPIPPGGSVVVCNSGYWSSAYLSTSGCCYPYPTFSHTGFSSGYFDDRTGDVSNLHIFAAYPNSPKSFLMWNRSGLWVWYTVQVQ
jgi:hypothetical protein